MSDSSAMDTSSPATAAPGHAANRALVEEFNKWRTGKDDVTATNLDKRSKIKFVRVSVTGHHLHINRKRSTRQCRGLLCHHVVAIRTNNSLY